MKHVGKMKNNGAKVVVAYRTLPGDPYSALVLGTSGLGESYHDSLMSLLQSDSGQQAKEFADIMASRKFPDGSNMLSWFHSHGLLKKVPTKMVIMTPTTQSSIQLDELNNLIAEQKGVSLEELAVSDESAPVKTKGKPEEITTTILEENTPIVTEMSASELRSKADALFKQAQQLRKKADEIDPPKSKLKKLSTSVE